MCQVDRGLTRGVSASDDDHVSRVAQTRLDRDMRYLAVGRRFAADLRVTDDDLRGRSSPVPASIAEHAEDHPHDALGDDTPESQIAEEEASASSCEVERTARRVFARETLSQLRAEAAGDKPLLRVLDAFAAGSRKAAVFVFGDLIASLRE